MISLNASMRNTLLSLRNISAQQDNMQMILSTGKKVNSAIDNPSSYYQATSLTNRAADLLNLLNSMEQGIQTIQAANTGVDTALNLLEQMEAIANQAGTQAPNVPAKEYFENLVGANGAVVTTAEELQNAIATNKETICIYGGIDLGDISTSGGLELKANQKLVGVGYFGNFDSDIGKFSSITATDTRADGTLINISQQNCQLSDLSINYSNSLQRGKAFAVYISGANNTTNLHNLDINAQFNDDDTNSNVRGAIYSKDTSTVNISGNINMSVSGHYGSALYTASNSICNITAGTKLNIHTYGKYGYGMLSHTNAVINIEQNTTTNIYTKGQSATGIYAFKNFRFNIYGKLQISTVMAAGIQTATTGGNTISIKNSAQVYLNTYYAGIYNTHNTSAGSNTIEIEQGAKLALSEKGSPTQYYLIQKGYKDENTSTSISNHINASNVTQKLAVTQTSNWKLPANEINFSSSLEDNNALTLYNQQFSDALNQYDQLIKDSYYKGINLLKGDSLKINFNETGEHNILVQGKDITSSNIGLSEVLGQSLSDVFESIDSLKSAIGKLRSLSEDLGSQFNIIQTRIDFTSALTNVLEEGADKLTLADMNEASAQYLTLQTRQSLAINSLSLASQAHGQILRLFY